MIWQNGWAWLGIAAIALPILIHLLGRGHARVQRFPTLRFLDASRLLPTRRTRVHDLLLLLVRVAIIAAGVAALAQPLWLTADRTRTLDAALVRAIIVDTSASMTRLASSGEPGLVVARREATRLAGEAQNSVVIETAMPAEAVAGAVAWLGRQPARSELVLVSDFQLGAIDSADIARVPSSMGVRVARIDIRSTGASIEDTARIGDGETIARIAPSVDRTNVEWLARTATRSSDSLTILSGVNERARVAAAIVAASTIGVRLPLDTARQHDVAIVEPHFEQRSAILRRAQTPKQRWMIDMILRLRYDGALQQAAEGTAPLGADSSVGIAVARNAAGQPGVVGVQDTANGHARLAFISSADAGSLASAMLIAATQRALSRAVPLSEFEPLALPENVVASWQREPAANRVTRRTANADGGASDGRWLWAVVLVLLGLETWMRRVRREAIAEQQVHDRAA